MNKATAAVTAGLIAAIGLVTAPPADAAGATVTRFTDVSQFVFEGSLPECFDPDLIGTNYVTETVSGQFVENPGGGFTVHGIDIFDYRVDFSNGMYAYGTGIGHFAFAANAGGTTVYTEAGAGEPRTVYAADGTPVAQVVIHAGSHITYRDSNGDGEPQPNEISANIERFLFTCH